MPDARELAEQLIAETAEQITYQRIWEHVTDRAGPLSGAQRTALTRQVDGLIGEAVITVTFPSSPGRKFTIGEVREDDAPPCTCFTTNPHAVNCRYRFWLATREDQHHG